MSFDKALEFTLKAEGGFANDPQDSGGATNYGITQATYNAFRRGQRFMSVKMIAPEDVREIYLRNFWGECHCDGMKDELATAVFDTAVNTGCQRAIKILQACLDIDADGIFGKQTRNAVNSITDIKDFTSRYLDERSHFYQRLVQLKPDKRKFLTGWLNRVQHLREFIFTTV